jgi:hypothetical protein
MVSQMTAPIEEIEAALSKMPGVRAVRLVTDEQQTPTEVHVIATQEKSPKQLVRDVQTVSMAQFGLELDHRIVSIVQFPDLSPLGPNESRPAIEQISTSVRGNQATVKVSLIRDNKIAEGEASGANTRESLVRLGATAAIKAIVQVLDRRYNVEIDHAGTQRVGAHDLAVVTISLHGPHGSMTLSGSAMMGEMAVESIVRAVLDAINRRVWRAD